MKKNGKTGVEINCKNNLSKFETQFVSSAPHSCVQFILSNVLARSRLPTQTGMQWFNDNVRNSGEIDVVPQAALCPKHFPRATKSYKQKFGIANECWQLVWKQFVFLPSAILATRGTKWYAKHVVHTLLPKHRCKEYAAFRKNRQENIALRSLTAIFCWHFLYAPCTDSQPYTRIVHSSFHEEPIKEILRAIFFKKKRRELAKSNVTSLLPEAMFTEHNVFTTSVAFALLVCDHWWFWVLFNFPRKTTYCLGPIAGIILHSVGVYLKILWEQGNQPTNSQKIHHHQDKTVRKICLS